MIPRFCDWHRDRRQKAPWDAQMLVARDISVHVEGRQGSFKVERPTWEKMCARTNRLESRQRAGVAPYPNPDAITLTRDLPTTYLPELVMRLFFLAVSLFELLPRLQQRCRVFKTPIS